MSETSQRRLREVDLTQQCPPEFLEKVRAEFPKASETALLRMAGQLWRLRRTMKRYTRVSANFVKRKAIL